MCFHFFSFWLLSIFNVLFFLVFRTKIEENKLYKDTSIYFIYSQVQSQTVEVNNNQNM